MSDIHDRGSIKWTAMMMPEHIKMLKDLWQTENHKQKPLLDEQELEEINMKLQMAIHNNLTVEVKYFKNHDYHKVRGKINKIDAAYLHLNDDKIPLKDVLDVFID